MENYRILYRIRIQHDYFKGRACENVLCLFAHAGEALAFRRKLLLRHTAPDEWTLLFDKDPDTESDVLFLNLVNTSSMLPIYTACEGWEPSADYELRLPASSETVEVFKTMRPTGMKRAIGSGFCTLSLRLTDEMLQAAKAGKPMQTVLHFEAAEAQWEFQFFHRENEPLPSGQLVLEDRTGQLKFTAFEEQEIRGRKAWITRSESRIRMSRDYPYALRLILYNEGTQKRVLLARVAPPEPGQYLDAPKGILRRIGIF